VRAGVDGQPAAATAPGGGYGPADLVSAYALPTTGGAGKTVAIVDAQDDPTAESDLAVYRSQFGLPPCTTANGCFKKVDQTGGTHYPSHNAGWEQEISLDLDMVSAVCPSCNILLVEANSASYADLGTAVNTAASLGAAAISNSYGGGETSSTNADYNHPGILVTASAGDSGYGAQFPASSPYVLAIGGTSLTTSTSSRGWAEAAWNGTGSGCSALFARPSWQTDSLCGNRVEADVSAVADPNTGVGVYDSGSGGWLVFGGTSVSSPLVAAAFTLMGLSGQSPSFVWGHTSDFYDVTSGSNGSCSPAGLCNAGVGYDGPTGWGTPNGSKLGSTCTPQCSGKSCGSDGCGGSCGTCPTGDTCNSSGQCVCTPSCTGKSCGSDGCGGSCGTCPSGETCNSSGQCVTSCTPNCTGLSCGSDGCGGSCGSCPSGDTCNSSGQCVASCTPNCTGKQCGADGCGGSCGTCPTGDTCNASQQCVCTPSCSGKQCGSDGCGGTCGSCPSGETCGSNGTCAGSTCAHSECTTGTRLARGCDACVSKVCQADRYCCRIAWDATCVSEVPKLCGETCP
jgi:hypothetical protein